MLDYQNDLLIDKNRLDEEWIQQPSKMMRYSVELAQAIYNRNRSKENLDVIEASLDAEARREPAPAGLGKATETAIKNWIKLQDTYREALEAYHDTDLEVNLIQGAVNDINANRNALPDLVKLYLSGYWSEPRLGQDGKTIREAGETKIRDDLNAALNRPEEVKNQEQQAVEAIASLPQPERGPGLVSPNSPPRPQPIVRRQPK